MPKAKKAAPIKGAVLKPVRQGSLTVPTIIIDQTEGLKPGAMVQFIPSNGITYTGEIGTIVGDQVFFKDGVKPV